MSKVKIAVLESQVNRLLEKQKELTERVRANEKVVAAIGLLGSVVIAILGTGIFQKAEACSMPLDGIHPHVCPPWDGVLLPEKPKGITEESFDEEFPDAFTHTVTLYDTRDDDPFDIAHMGHSFPTDQWIQKMRDHEAKKKRTSIEDMLNNTLTEYENGSNGSTKQEVLLQLPSDGD